MPSWSRFDPPDLSLQGLLYSVSFEGSIGSGQSSYSQVKTGALKTTVTHFGLVSVSENMRFTVLEAPTITNGTTQVAAINVNRNSANTALTTFYTDPTSISGGTQILVVGFPSGSNKVGGIVDNEFVWTCLPNTSYVVKIDNLGNSTSSVFFNMGFYEH